MSAGGADRRAIDLLFLLQESVLVFDETHDMLEALAARETRIDRDRVVLRKTWRADSNAPRLRPLRLVAKVAALVVVLTFVIELVDPAPMDVLAFRSAPASSQSSHPRPTPARLRGDGTPARSH